MTVYQIGDDVALSFTAPSDATVELHVTAPDGTESAPATSNVSTAWSATVADVDQLGQWLFTWIATGAGDDVEQGTFQVGSPWYATLAEAKNYLGLTSTNVDVQLSDSLATASRDIDKVCGRKFWKSTTATARIYYPEPDRNCRTAVDDFWTTTDLVIKTDSGGTGTFPTTQTAYELYPLNGVVDGEEGWPYWKIKPVGWTWATGTQRASLQVTAKWGWENVPPGVKTACIIAADEAMKLAREAPFGVAGLGTDGVVRIRSNTRLMALLGPYVRDPIRVALG